MVVQVLIFSGCSFILHLIWELIQCVPFFIHLVESPSIKGLLFATLGDVVLTFVGFGMTWLTTQNRNWITGEWRTSTWFGLIGSALLLSIGLEIFALETSRWKYTDLNPIIPFLNVSILPVVQLIFLFPASFWITRKVLNSRTRDFTSRLSKDSLFLFFVTIGHGVVTELYHVGYAT